MRPLLERLLEREPLLRELLREPLLREPLLRDPPPLEPPPPRPPRWLISSSSVADVGAASTLSPRLGAKAERAAAGCSISRMPIAPAKPVLLVLFVTSE